MSFFAACYPYYSGMCSNSYTAWFAAAYCVIPHRFHAATLFRCRLFSMYLNCVMAEGRVVQSVVGCVLAIARPRFPPRCGRCDGPHCTEQCPHYAETRPDHPDACMHHGNAPPEALADGNDMILRDAVVVRQPGDGACLFHSLGAGLEAFGEIAGRHTE